MRYWILTLLIISIVSLNAQTIDSVAIKQVDSLINISRDLTAKNDFSKALNVNAAAEKIALENWGNESPGYVTCCMNHARVLYFSKDISESISWYEKSKNICDKVTGKNNPIYAMIIGALAIAYEDMGNLEKAEANYVEALEIRKNILGTNNPRYANSLNNLALLYLKIGNYVSAEPLFLEAISIRNKIQGKEHPDYLQVLSNLGILYKKTAQYWKAETLYLEAKEQYEKNPALPRIGYSECLMNLGNLYSTMAEYEKAEAVYRISLTLRQQIHGTKHPEYAAILDNMAGMYCNEGDYERAETMFLEALRIREEMQLDKTASLHNLGLLYFYMGNYEKAIQYNESVLALKKSSHEDSTPDFAISLTTLANLRYYAYKDCTSAEQLYTEALSIIESSLGKNHPDYAIPLENLANLYTYQGNYSRAKLMYKEILKIRNNELGNNHPEYAKGLINLANNYRLQGNLEAAEKIFVDAGTILAKKLGRSHPEFTYYLKYHGTLYFQAGQIDKAVSAFREIAAVNKKLLQRSLRHLSEKELIHYQEQFNEAQNQLLTIARLSGLPDLASDCYDYLLFNKGFALNASIQMRRIGRLDTLNARKLSQLRSISIKLSAEYSRPILDQDSNAIATLELEFNDLEKDLARSSAEFIPFIQQINWKEIVKTLKDQEIAVEFIDYQVNFPNNSDSTMYAALLLKPGIPEPLFIQLFEKKSLDSLLHSKADRKADYVNGLYTLSDRGAVAIEAPKKSLYGILWKPLEKELTGIKTIYFSPSGLLHRINLDAIPVSETETLADRYNLIELNSTRQLVIPTPIKNTNNDAVLFGGIQFEQDSTLQNNEPLIASRSRGELSFNSVDSTLRGGSWNYLAHTEREVNSIEKLMLTAGMKVNLKKGYQATEASFKNIGANNAASPRILHIATHGYFFPDPKEQSMSIGLSGQNEPVFKKSDHPMLRSGLIMAGGNAAWQGKQTLEGREDGILTAYEISQMNLSNTELVVLSACETGLGDIQGNEGVYGLQRAFKIAGVKYLIMSLWQVPDKQTSMLMTTFYRKWLEDKLSIPQAFHAAQKELREMGFDPYQWAGFVLVE